MAKKWYKNLESKKTIWGFVLASFIGGLLFVDYGFTGNVISETEIIPSLLSYIGVALLISSLILVSYNLKKRN